MATKLKAEKREILKKKVKNLRAEGKIPCVAYGPKLKSVNLIVDQIEFKKLFREAGYSNLVDLEIEGTKKPQKVLIKEVQVDPLSGERIHVSFYAVDMTEELETEIPIEVVGVAPAVKTNIGFLEIPENHIMVKCLPENLPSEIKINVEKLAEVGDYISIGDLDLPEGVKAVEDDEERIMFIAPPQKIEFEEVKEETEEGEEGEEGETAEGEEGEGSEEGAEGSEGAKDAGASGDGKASDGKAEGGE